MSNDATVSPHPNHASVDQSDRKVPINLRQSGPTAVELLISTRIRKSPYWHLSMDAGCWRAEVYNRVYHPRGYVRPEDGGTYAEYDALVNHVTLWNVAVERQIQVKGPDAEAFVNFVITRDATKIPVMRARYVILCNEAGGILNDPVLLRVAEDEFWFSLSDSDLWLWLQGVNVGKRFDVQIAEIDVAPVQIQGPKSVDLLVDLVGPELADLPSYGLMEATVAGHPVIISQTGFTGEKGYEIYLRDATLHAEDMWNAVLEASKPHQLKVIAPAHHRRVAAGILSWGQDMDAETLPFQVNLAYQVPRKKEADYIGKAALETIRARGVHRKLAGIEFEGDALPFEISRKLAARHDGETVGTVTDLIWSPRLERNIGYVWVPFGLSKPGTHLEIEAPDGGLWPARTAAIPFIDPRKDTPKS